MHLGLIVLSLLLVADQGEQPSADERTLQVQQTLPTVVSREQRALADRVVRAYRDLGYLSFRMEVKSESYHLIVNCRMAPGKLKTTVYAAPDPESRDDPRLLAMFLFRDGFIKEYSSRWRAPNGPLVYRDVVVEYPARFMKVGSEPEQWQDDPIGAVSPLLDHESYCLIGSLFQTWVGPKATKPEYHRKVIESGHVLNAPMEIDGSPCWVVMWEPDRGDYVRRDVFYFERKSLMLRKWDTLEGDKPDPPRLTRSRNYSEIQFRADEPDDERLWDFDTAMNNAQSR